MKRSHFVAQVAAAAGALHDKITAIASRRGAIAQKAANRMQRHAIADLRKVVNEALGRKRPSMSAGAKLLGELIADVPDAPPTPNPVADPEPDRAPIKRASSQSSTKTCSKCGFLGGNARGCGTAHDTLPAATAPALPEPSPIVHDDDEDDEDGPIATPPTRPRALSPEPKRPRAPRDLGGEFRLDEPTTRSRIKPSGKPPELGMRKIVSPAPSPLSVEADEELDEHEPLDLASGIAWAEANKHIGGELPTPSSSFVVAPNRGGLANIYEVEVGAT